MKYFKSIWKPALLRTALFLFILNGSILNVIAQEPKLSISLNKVTIKQFFNEIQRKTDYTFSYREGILNNNKDVSISVHNKNLSEILKSVLDSKGLSFSIQAKSIVITQQRQTSISIFHFKRKSYKQRRRTSYRSNGSCQKQQKRDSNRLRREFLNSHQ